MAWTLSDDDAVELRVMQALDVTDACRAFRDTAPHRRQWWWSRRSSGRTALFEAAEDLAHFALECVDRKHRESFERLHARADSRPS